MTDSITTTQETTVTVKAVQSVEQSPSLKLLAAMEETRARFTLAERRALYLELISGGDVKSF